MKSKSSKKKNYKIKDNNIHHIIIDTPCSVSDIESFLSIVSHEGHWHDAIVKGKDNKIIIEFKVD